MRLSFLFFFFFFQAEDGIRDYKVTGVQTCALPISAPRGELDLPGRRRRPERGSAVRSLGVRQRHGGLLHRCRRTLSRRGVARLDDADRPLDGTGRRHPRDPGDPHDCGGAAVVRGGPAVWRPGRPFALLLLLAPRAPAQGAPNPAPPHPPPPDRPEARALGVHPAWPC